LGVSKQLEYDSVENFRKQDYQKFIDKMFEIYNSERRYRKNLADKKEINVSIKEIAIDTYQPTLMKLQRLADTKRAKGFVAPAFGDYTQYELEHSTGLNDAIDDLEYELLPGNFFPPHNIATAISSLSQIRYKNTKLIPKIRNKMLAMLSGTDERPADAFQEEDGIFGERSGKTEKWHVYSGFKDNKEFYKHVETLLAWKTEEKFIKDAEMEAQSIKDDTKSEYLEVVEIMKNIINASKEAKNIQKEMFEAINEVRNQYTTMSEAFDEIDFLKDHPYIKYDLLELQEKLVNAGIMHPDEATGKTQLSKMSLSDKMNRAQEVFYELTQDYFPDAAPMMEHLFGDLHNPEARENISLIQKETQNELNLKYIGLILGKLAEMRESIRRDNVPINEYFENKFYPHELHNDPYAKKRDPEIEHMKKDYTMFWNEVTNTYNAMFPTITKSLNSKEQIPLNHLLCLNYGITQGGANLSKQLERKIKEALENEIPRMNTSELMHGLQGLANSTISEKTKREVVEKLRGQIDSIKVHCLNLNEKLRLAWGL
jgi:hypothetical protein